MFPFACSIAAKTRLVVKRQLENTKIISDAVERYVVAPGAKHNYWERDYPGDASYQMVLLVLKSRKQLRERLWEKILNLRKIKISQYNFKFM